MRITYPMVLKQLNYRILYRRLGSNAGEIKAVRALESRLDGADTEVLYRRFASTDEVEQRLKNPGLTFRTDLRNQMATAKTLHVHRSTLIYRIKRIRDIMNVDLNDTDTLFHLLLSFKLLDYAGRFLQPQKRVLPD